MKTFVICTGCKVFTRKWYNMREEGTYCPVCYVETFPELADIDDIERANEFEAMGD